MDTHAEKYAHCSPRLNKRMCEALGSFIRIIIGESYIQHQ